MPLYVDPSGREPSRHTLVWLGALVLVIVIAVGTVIGRWTTGGFAEHFRIILRSEQVGDGLRAGTDVRYRGLRIGHVESVAVDDRGGQRIVLDLDPARARALTTGIVPIYTASSIFTGTDIEFVPGPVRGAPLHNGAVLRTDTGTSFGTLTSVLNRAGKLTSTLGDPQVYQALQQIANDADPYIRLLREVLPVAADLTEAQKVPMKTLMSETADLLGAVRPLIVPVLGVIDGTLDASAYMDDPVALKNTNDAILGLAKKVVLPIGGILGDNEVALQHIIELALDVATPLVLSFASFPRAYERLSEVLAHTSDAFTAGDDGRTRLNVELILAHAPQVAAAALIEKKTE